uniref:Uncharacterized protein n=1 Tax=Nelumbo nucifera TaxID=4432 RepID=A0A822ZNC8_NELNU|nr:TPA_asm: hypothetical protein HUJ06_004200 [Nelumbo nucifera]
MLSSQPLDPLEKVWERLNFDMLPRNDKVRGPISAFGECAGEAVSLQSNLKAKTLKQYEVGPGSKDSSSNLTLFLEQQMDWAFDFGMSFSEEQEQEVQFRDWLKAQEASNIMAQPSRFIL